MSEPTRFPVLPDSRASGLFRTHARSRLATVLGTLLTVFALGLCGLCGAGLYYFRPVQTVQPESVAPLTAQMLRVDVPPVFEPRGTIEWNFFWVVLMRGTYYELASDEGLLMFLQIDSGLMDEPDVREHVDRTLRDKGGGGPPLEITQSSEKIFNIDGVNRVFRYRVGESPADQTKYRLVEGTLDGYSGTVLVAFRIAEESWELYESDVQRTIDSLSAR